MAHSSSPFRATGATVAVVGTAVVPTLAIPDNCHTVIIYNIGSVDGLIGRAAPGAGALTEGTNAARVPSGGSITLPLGTSTVRGIMDNAVAAGSGLVYDAVSGALSTPTFDIIYLCSLTPGITSVP